MPQTRYDDADSVYVARVSSSQQLQARALPANAPHGYTPQTNDCPSNTPSIRVAGSLSNEESTWLKTRRESTIQPMIDLLGRLKIKDLNTEQYINNNKYNVSNLPNIGIAVSGGGYRAMLNGAGVLEAFDSRTPNSTAAGQLGGLLQSTTYLSGLSGGSWLVGSLFTNNYTSISDILAHDTDADGSGSLWQFGEFHLRRARYRRCPTTRQCGLLRQSCIRYK